MSNSISLSNLWSLENTLAKLQTTGLTAEIDLLKPHAGLGQLCYESAVLPGFVLGVELGISEPLPSGELQDVFLRGNDLAVTYAATQERPFSLQVYWRATTDQRNAVVVDTILSLQTDLLESFPALTVTTQLPAASVWQLAGAGSTAPELIFDSKEQRHSLSSESSDSLLLRPADKDWSYAETTHPEDRGNSQIRLTKSQSYCFERNLGGGFLEKGVIRRLRVRGAFLPRENDARQAAEYFSNLVTEQPPLTT